VLPVPRLPGTAGSGPAITSGVNDTVILERPNANITVTLSSGTYNVRKLYMRETLNITGGSLTINYDPLYNFNVGNANALRSGTISAQFSGAVSMSGSASLTVPSLQVDGGQTFTLTGGTLVFNKINLLSNAKILVNGDVAINPLNTSNPRYTSLMASITSASSSVDLGGGTRTFTIGNSSSDVDVDVAVPITNGGLIKSGAGTMRLSGNNTFSGPVTVNGGVLRYNHSSGLAASSVVTVNNTGTLDMNGITDTIAALASDAGNTTGAVLQGAAGLTLSAASGEYTFRGSITGTGALAKTGAAKQVLTGTNSLGAVNISAGSLLFNGLNSTGVVTVGATATLGGTGELSGAVTVNSGGHVAPGASIESLYVGSLSLLSGSQLDFELGAAGLADRIDVGGALTLSNGTVLNLSNVGGMSIGTYSLIGYGSLVGSITDLGAPVGGPSQFKYALADTGSEITLKVSMFGDFNDDGSVDAMDYNIWRKGMGTSYTEADYDVWRAHFGETAAGLAAAAAQSSGAVPEPGSIALLATGILTLCYRRPRV
jgi:autotransporter-associated beta strand protein